MERIGTFNKRIDQAGFRLPSDNPLEIAAKNLVSKVRSFFDGLQTAFNTTQATVPIIQETREAVSEMIPPWNDNETITSNAPDWETFQNFIKDKETPCLVINLENIRKKYKELETSLMEKAKIYYAVKANPSDEILEQLENLGSNFDIASRRELDQVLNTGASPDRISFGNTIKKEKDIKYAYKKGVRLFVCDSFEDLEKLSRQAPGSKVFFRLLVEGADTADWPLSKKFGASNEVIHDIIIKANELNLIPHGLSFHVGSQQKDLHQWDKAIDLCVDLMKDLKENHEIELKLLNLGGGFPAYYNDENPSVESYCVNIMRKLFSHFGASLPEIIVEPGRSLVGDSGIIVSEVVMVSKKSKDKKDPRWVYLDVGKFNGLPETMTAPGSNKECIKYQIFTDKNGEESPVILAGPTCDSMDTLYEYDKIKLPNDIKSGDKVYIPSTGAYTASYSSIDFNGLPPLSTHTIPLPTGKTQTLIWKKYWNVASYIFNSFN